jgi:aconitate hydratase
MNYNVAQKLIQSHLVSGNMVPGEGIALKIDQTLTQDATGTMTYLQFEAIGVPRVKTEFSISYVDHGMLQITFENADDHLFLMSTAAKFGLAYSRPGNGICHQVHQERFGKPGKSLLGADSHTPTAGGIGMLAFGAGGMDVATAMAGEPYQLMMPQIVNVRLTGKLCPWVSAKDVILEMLRRLTVKGGVNKIFEFTGPGLSCITVPGRCTIANLGTELGATTTVFPSDEITRAYLKAQNREEDFIELVADEGAHYHEEMEINLSTLEPLVAKPHMPDQVVPVRELKKMPLRQVFVGSCTNSSYLDIVNVAKILKGKVIHPDVEMSLSPGSRQTFQMIAQEGYLADLIASGVRILESGCGPCSGTGQAPPSGSVSLRTSPRNFEGRCGTMDAGVYLASAETCAASALCGYLVDAQEHATVLNAVAPEQYIVDDRMIIMPPEDGSDVEIIRGPNIKPLPVFEALEDTVETSVVIKVGDNITTDHIIPGGPINVKLRSNVPAISKKLFSRIDTDFSSRIEMRGSGIIVGGNNYGQGSSREHAALCSKYYNVKAVIVKSFARIHMQNLINFGILPLIFDDESIYDLIDQDDTLRIKNIIESTKQRAVTVTNVTKEFSFTTHMDTTDRHVQVLLKGGLLRLVRAL